MFLNRAPWRRQMYTVLVLISPASSLLAEMTQRYNLTVKKVHSAQLKGKISVRSHRNTAVPVSGCGWNHSRGSS